MGEWVRDCDVEDFWQGHDWVEAYASLIAHDCPDIPAAKELAALMSEISEEQYCAGWEHGLEFSLFAFAYEGAQYGDGPSPEQRQGLMELARRCDGWWWYKSSEGQRYMRMEAWTEMYKPF